VTDRGAVPDPGSGPDPGSPTGTGAGDPGERGSLVVEDRAVQRIAEAAALDVPGVARAAQSAGGLGSALGRSYPRVRCDVAGGRVRAEVEIVGCWPTPAAQLGAAVRDAVTDRLQRLAGLRVDAVDVTVAKIVRVAAPARRRVR
jgi:uncharacterized alkaline shock family protein YloU